MVHGDRYLDPLIIICMVFSLSYIGGTRNLNPSRIAVRFYLRDRNIQRDFIEFSMPIPVKIRSLTSKYK
jgi:hypothetical protein